MSPWPSNNPPGVSAVLFAGYGHAPFFAANASTSAQFRTDNPINFVPLTGKPPFTKKKANVRMPQFNCQFSSHSEQLVLRPYLLFSVLGSPLISLFLSRMLSSPSQGEFPCPSTE